MSFIRWSKYSIVLDLYERNSYGVDERWLNTGQCRGPVRQSDLVYAYDRSPVGSPSWRIPALVRFGLFLFSYLILYRLELCFLCILGAWSRSRGRFLTGWHFSWLSAEPILCKMIEPPLKLPSIPCFGRCRSRNWPLCWWVLRLHWLVAWVW